MYAIIATGGKQYKVSEGDVIRVEKLDAEVGAAVTFDQVVAISDNELKVAGDVAPITFDLLSNFKSFGILASKPYPLKAKHNINKNNR